MRLFIVNGYAGSGKDTFVGYATEELSKRQLSTKNIHSSDRAKEALRLLNWSGVKTKYTRKLLSELCNFGQARRVSTEMINQAMGEGYDIVFYHERNPEQIKLLHREYPRSQSIWIERPDTEPQEEDIWGMKDYDYDFVIYNMIHLEGLKNATKSFITSILKEDSI